MQFRNCAVADVEAAVAAANEEHAYDMRLDFTSGHNGNFRGRLLPVTGSSTRNGRRRSPSGRRVHAMCWHAHLAMLRALFERVPQARVTTALADYKGRANFEATWPNTGDKNIGPAFDPMSYEHACDCER